MGRRSAYWLWDGYAYWFFVSQRAVKPSDPFRVRLSPRSATEALSCLVGDGYGEGTCCVGVWVEGSADDVEHACFALVSEGEEVMLVYLGVGHLLVTYCTYR